MQEVLEMMSSKLIMFPDDSQESLKRIEEFYADRNYWISPNFSLPNRVNQFAQVARKAFGFRHQIKRVVEFIKEYEKVVSKNHLLIKEFVNCLCVMECNIMDLYKEKLMASCLGGSVLEPIEAITAQMLCIVEPLERFQPSLPRYEPRRCDEELDLKDLYVLVSNVASKATEAQKTLNELVEYMQEHNFEIPVVTELDLTIDNMVETMKQFELDEKDFTIG